MPTVDRAQFIADHLQAYADLPPAWRRTACIACLTVVLMDLEGLDDWQAQRVAMEAVDNHLAQTTAPLRRAA